MGQVLSAIQDKLNGREWKEKQIRKITDRVYDCIIADTGSVSANGLTFDDVYTAVLRVYEEIDKYLNGVHCVPPTKEKLQARMEEYDINLDGLLDREEFADFILRLTSDAITAVSRDLIIALIVAPTLALLTKRSTEGVPGVGKVVQKLPSPVYASIVTLGVVLAQKSNGFSE